MINRNFKGLEISDVEDPYLVRFTGVRLKKLMSDFTLELVSFGLSSAGFTKNHTKELLLIHL